mmetsp:Transcript_2717/g.5068  ORF Transcript_2717/g.5068 Transcript_2717/m.5068 type:complete len:108 (-) Transcript_2717:1105-1428(-)
MYYILNLELKKNILENSQLKINTRSNGLLSTAFVFASESKFLWVLNNLKSRFTGEQEETGEGLLFIHFIVEISELDLDRLAEKTACRALSERILSLRADASSSFDII